MTSLGPSHSLSVTETFHSVRNFQKLSLKRESETGRNNRKLFLIFSGFLIKDLQKSWHSHQPRRDVSLVLTLCNTALVISIILSQKKKQIDSVGIKHTSVSCWWPYQSERCAERWRVWAPPAGTRLDGLLIQRELPQAGAQSCITLTRPDSKNSKSQLQHLKALWLLRSFERVLNAPLRPANILLSNLFTCWAEMMNLFSSVLLFLPPLLQEVKLGAEESRALRTRIQLAEAAQKQARGMEMDYEEVIHLLEAEIAELKTQRVEPPPSTNKVTDVNSW